MSVAVVNGASCVCSFGTAPGTLNSTNNFTVLADGKPICLMTDIAGGANISPFAMCTSLANPAVSAATAAALGVLTPQPCMPTVAGTWMGGAKTLVGGKPCLTLDSKCMCSFAGSISIVNPGQTKVMIN